MSPQLLVLKEKEGNQISLKDLKETLYSRYKKCPELNQFQIHKTKTRKIQIEFKVRINIHHYFAIKLKRETSTKTISKCNEKNYVHDGVLKCK